MSISYATIEERIAAIEDLLGDGKPVPDADIIWLCRRLRGFAIPRLEEFDFPEYCALISRGGKSAVAVRQLRRPRIEGELRDCESSLITALDHVVEVPNTDSVVVARPWVKVMITRGNRDRMLDDLVRRYQLKLFVDHRLVGDAPIGEFLMTEDGIGLRTMKPKLIVSQDQQLVRAAMVDDSYQTATPANTFGLGLLNGQRIAILLESDTGAPRIPDLLVGVTAAQYTSRSAVNGTSVDLRGAL